MLALRRASLNVAISVAGIAATGALDPVTQETSQSVSVLGAGATGSTITDAITVTANSNVTLTGIEASGQAGSVLVWGHIVPSLNTIWTEIAA